MINYKIKFEEIESIVKEISKNKNVKAIYLFGSYATGKNHVNSDIDICVIAEKLSDKDEISIIGAGYDNLDISLFNYLPITIRYRVFKEGKPLFIRDNTLIYSLKAKTLRDYIEFKPSINRFCIETLKCMT